MAKWMKARLALSCMAALMIGLGLSPSGASAETNVAVSPASTASHAQVTLDTAAVHDLYNDGDFDKVLSALEPHLQAKTPISREESVFVFKHLGVIFSKDASTREKGKYCFRKLFDLDPKAQILDMYATDDIYAVFRTVHDEWALSHPEFAKTESSVTPQPQAIPQQTPSTVSAVQPATSQTKPLPQQTKPAQASAGKQTDWKIWSIAGGAAVVTAGVAAWFLLSQSPEKTTTTLVIDPGTAGAN